MLPDSNRPVLYFDGICNLCNGFVQFIIRNDKQGHFIFASLQSGAGEEIQQLYRKLYGKVPDSLILYYKHKFYTRSDAALKVAELLGSGWRLATIGYLLPRFMRNGIYNLTARNRYKWFGKREECMMPTPELRSRFLD